MPLDDNYDDDIDDALDEMVVGSPSDPDAWPGALPKQAAFLTALVICAGHKGEAAKAARISRRMHYKWFPEPVYAALFAEASRQASDVMLDEARRRAFRGTRKAIWWQGVKVGHELVYSDSTIQFLLRGDFPEKYKDRHQTEHVGAGGGPLNITVSFVKPE